MTMVYGSFLLSHIPAEGIETEAQKLAVLEQFANLDMAYASKFREVIDGKVVEFQDNVKAIAPEISYHWLKEDGAEANAVLNVRNQRGWVPASYFQFLDGYGNLFVPYGDNAFGDYELNLPGGNTFEFRCVSASLGIHWIRTLNERLALQAQESPDWAATCCGTDSLADILEFHNQLVLAMEACMNAEVIFMIGN